MLTDYMFMNDNDRNIGIYSTVRNILARLSVAFQYVIDCFTLRVRSSQLKTGAITASLANEARTAHHFDRRWIAKTSPGPDHCCIWAQTWQKIWDNVWKFRCSQFCPCVVKWTSMFICHYSLQRGSKKAGQSTFSPWFYNSCSCIMMTHRRAIYIANVQYLIGSKTGVWSISQLINILYTSAVKLCYTESDKSPFGWSQVYWPT